MFNYSPSAGLRELLGNALGCNAFTNYTYFWVDLYQNNHVPAFGDTFGDYLLCDFPGYSTINLRSNQFAFLEFTITGECVFVYSSNPVWWQNSGTEQVVFGYLVRSSQTGNVLWAEYFDSPIILKVNQQVRVTVQVNLGNLSGA